MSSYQFLCLRNLKLTRYILEDDQKEILHRNPEQSCNLVDLQSGVKIEIDSNDESDGEILEINVNEGDQVILLL